MGRSESAAVTLTCDAGYMLQVTLLLDLKLAIHMRSDVYMNTMCPLHSRDTTMGMMGVLSDSQITACFVSCGSMGALLRRCQEVQCSPWLA